MGSSVIRSIDLPKYVDWLLVASACLLCANFVAGASWVFVAALLGGLSLLVGIMYAPRLLVYIMLVGIPSLFVLVDIAISSRGIPGLTVGRALMVVLVGFLFLKLVFGKTELPRLSTLEKTMLAYLAIVLLSYASTIPSKSGGDLFQGAVLLFEAYIMPFGAYLIARSLDWSERQIRNLLIMLACLGIYLFANGVAQYFFGFYGLSPTYLERVELGARATGGFGSPLEYGMVMIVIMLCSLILYSQASANLAKMFYVGVAGLALIGIGICLTRAQWLAAVVTLGFAFVVDKRVRGIMAVGALLFTTALVAAIPFIFQNYQIFTRITDVTSLYNRVALWGTALNAFFHNPIFGVGFGFMSFNDVKREYLFTVGPSAIIRYAAGPGVPHNEYLHILVMMGLVGFSAYVLVFLNLFRTSRACLLGTPAEDGYCMALARYFPAFLLIYGISGLTAELWTFSYFAMLLFFFGGLLASKTPKPSNARTVSGGHL